MRPSAKRAARPAALALLAAAGLAQGQQAPSPDLAALLECRASHADFVAAASLAETPLQAVAAGWQPLARSNMFMTEFRLARPARAFGHVVEQIAFTGEGIVAVLDLADPRPLAGALALEIALDTPEKLLAGREVRSDDAIDADGQAVIDSAVLSVSNVASHPGKTLAGCSYSIEYPEDPVAEDAVPPAPAGSPR